MTTYAKALAYAQEKHKDQVRKYTGEPYINHCLEVVAILEKHGINTEVAKMAAILHDTVEDTDATFGEIEKKFGPLVRNLVFYLTNIVGHDQGNRATRFELNVQHIVNSPYPLSLLIKCADLISNTKSIVERDPKFAKVYLAEKRALLQAMADSVHGCDETGTTTSSLYKRALELASQDSKAGAA